jgi:hypothetical protein
MGSAMGMATVAVIASRTRLSHPIVTAHPLPRRPWLKTLLLLLRSVRRKEGKC